jgi:hypothetical protein
MARLDFVCSSDLAFCWAKPIFKVKSSINIEKRYFIALFNSYKNNTEEQSSVLFGTKLANESLSSLIDIYLIPLQKIFGYGS